MEKPYVLLDITTRQFTFLGHTVLSHRYASLSMFDAGFVFYGHVGD